MNSKIADQLPVRSVEAARVIRVVVADDHDLVREGLCAVIGSCEDMRVVGEAIDGEQALSMALGLMPDVLVMDVNMPKLNGIHATRLIRDGAPEVAVIGLSMHNDNEVAVSMKKAGAAVYLAKGCPFEDLFNAIRSNARI